MKKFIGIALVLFLQNNFAQVKILFDNSKAESAGNADWVVDADIRNLYFTNAGTITLSGSESNAQRFPTASQAGINATTTESYWAGGLSAWAVDLAKLGYIVESLPYNASITYGDANNSQDLSNYKVYIVCEPNIAYTSAEKSAIINFVKNGGGLFMISDHNASDRNNDGWDSPKIWNDLMQNNAVQSDPFGISFDYANFSITSSAVVNNPSDSIINGPGGNVTQVKWSSGTTMSLNPSQNVSVTGDIYKTAPASGNANVLMAHAYFMGGRVAAIGDSSPCDDGSGDPGDVLYDGYIADAGGNHQKLLINTVIWLAGPGGTLAAVKQHAPDNSAIHIYPNPSNNYLTISANELIRSAEIFSAAGQKINITVPSDQIDIRVLSQGYYFLKITTKKGIYHRSFLKMD